MTAADDYLVERLRRRLAGDEVAELGIRVEERGGGVVLSGAVPDAPARDAVVRIAEEESGGSFVVCDLRITSAAAPDHAEELP
ncbi:BON domain-containing protein [Actinacidiphila sp. bgisy167]|uniref:BON domain-containing protein n=1 Tax=Actinacidiphila sp. bgisy167 TaxID=3413797 RepID=UPI003D744FC1